MQSRKTKPSAFTLVELMISIAIVLVLMLGINFVFSMSARTISTGMALSAVARDIRNSRRVVEQDFNSAVPAADMPAIMIHSEYVYTWRDKADKLGDRDGLPWTYDIDSLENNGDEIDMQPGGPTVAIPLPHPLRGLYNYRRHRVDRVSFFARHPNSEYTRQTGDDTTYVGPEKSEEAWIWYGFLRQPGKHPTVAALNDITYWKPGGRGDLVAGVFPDETLNQNNFFASQWILGRKVMLLTPAADLGAPGNIAFLDNVIGTGARQIAPNGTTQTYNRPNPPYSIGAPTVWQVQESRLDVVVGSIDDHIAGASGGIPLTSYAAGGMFEDADPTNHTTPTANRDYRSYQSPAPPASRNYLFYANPFVSKANNAIGPSNNFAQSMEWQTRQAAMTTPIFIRGCTQFMVEFAGDFYDQGPIGGGPEPVGTIDYVPDAAIPGAYKVRWYGLPRDVNDIPGIDDGDVNLIDVPPKMPGGGNGTPRSATAQNTQKWPAPPTAWTSIPDAPQIFAWLPPDPSIVGNPNNFRPKLIRITMEIVDANGRLGDGQRIEYVFALK